MKIKVVDAATKRAITGKEIQIQIQGKDSGFLTLTTGTDGTITLENNLQGQKIAVTGTGQLAWVTATEGATLLVPTKEKTTVGQGTGSKF